MGTAFKAANPNATVTFNFAGSSDLVTQIGQGAPADIFVSADDSNMKKLADAGEAVGAPVSIAKNTFQIIVEKGNPKNVTGVADLAKADLLVVLCAETVPCGKGAATILKNANVTVTPKSFEDKVKGVVTKVTAGEADAGIVFVTDVKAAGGNAAGVEIPDAQNVISKYPIVVTKEATNAATAKAFIDFVNSADGQAILAKFGFLAP
jgi:molybdate transport system substrate-binding protein